MSNPLRLKGTSAYIESSEIDPGELRRALLFWDKLVWPSTNGIFIDGGSDTEFLQSEGIMIRPHFSVNGDAATALSMTFVESFKMLEKLHPGQWVVSRGEKSLMVHGQDLTDNRGVITQIMNAIPVPDRLMPLEDVIRFKNHRGDQVVALRTAIEEFYQSWVNSEDPENQLKLALTKIDTASAEMLRVAKESQFPFSLSSWGLNFSIPVDVVWGTIVAAGGAIFGMNTTSALLGGLSTTLAISGGIGLRSPKTNSPFNYIATIEKELI